MKFLANNFPVDLPSNSKFLFHLHTYYCFYLTFTPEFNQWKLNFVLNHCKFEYRSTDAFIQVAHLILTQTYYSSSDRSERNINNLRTKARCFKNFYHDKRSTFLYRVYFNHKLSHRYQEVQGLKVYQSFHQNILESSWGRSLSGGWGQRQFLPLRLLIEWQYLRSHRYAKIINIVSSTEFLLLELSNNDSIAISLIL